MNKRVGAHNINFIIFPFLRTQHAYTRFSFTRLVSIRNDDRVKGWTEIRTMNARNFFKSSKQVTRHIWTIVQEARFIFPCIQHFTRTRWKHLHKQSLENSNTLCRTLSTRSSAQQTGGGGGEENVVVQRNNDDYRYTYFYVSIYLSIYLYIYLYARKCVRIERHIHIY